MPRSQLPQNYITRQPDVLIEDFNRSLSFWTKGAEGTLEIDSSYYTNTAGKTATKSLKFTAVSEWPGTSALSPTSSYNTTLLGDSGRILYIRGYNYPGSYCGGITITLGSVNGLTKNFEFFYNTSMPRQGEEFIIALPRTVAVNTGGESWTNPMIRLQVRVVASAGRTATVSLDSIYTGQSSIPGVVLSFDDGYKSVYDTAFPYMRDRGIKGTLYLSTTSLAEYQGGSGGITLAQCHELHDAGWDIANHTSDHTVLGNASLVIQKEKIKASTDFLLANGFTRGAYHIAYPGGSYNSDTLTALAELGMKTGRPVIGGLQQNPTENLYTIRMAATLGSDEATHTYFTLANAKLWVDRAISREGTAHIYGHQIIADHTSPSYNDIAWDTADFYALCDYIVAKKIRTYTISEWYNGLTNPRLSVVRG